MTQAVPHSAGTRPPARPTPPLACDAHCHILDPDPPGMALADYRRLQRRLGTTRAVLVQAKRHGTDHAVLLDALAALGGDGVGVGVVRADVGDAELARLHAGGVRGLRFSVWNPADALVAIADVGPLARRVAPLGWHVQLHMSAAQLHANAELVAGLPCPVVIDHMGRLPPGEGPGHPALAVLRRLLDAGRTWVKLSGAYLDTLAGPPGYPEAAAVARALVAAAPERLVWGSDWPHLTERHKPDDALLLDLLEGWAGDEATRRRILVDNPAKLYGFAD